MKKILIAAQFLALATGLASCGAGGEDPGRAYMPDMYYSRAYETYNYNDVGGEYDTLKARGISYTAMPVPGTVARGEELSYHLTNDSAGMRAAEQLRNPFDSGTVTKAALTEAERLYLVNCGICHGPKLDGNGPIVAGGAYPGQPADFTSSTIKALSDGHYFHVITFGIRSMGSYASQLTPDQRWWVIKYIRSQEAAAGGGNTDSTAAGKSATGTSATSKDSTTAK